MALWKCKLFLPPPKAALPEGEGNAAEGGCFASLNFNENNSYEMVRLFQLSRLLLVRHFIVKIVAAGLSFPRSGVGDLRLSASGGLIEAP